MYLNETTSGGSSVGNSKFNYNGATKNKDLHVKQINPDGHVDRFVSPNPDKFVILSVCLPDKSNRQGRCSEGLTAVLVKDQRPNREGDIRLEDLPLCQIENTLNESFDMSLSNNGQAMDWSWEGTECKMDTDTNI